MQPRTVLVGRPCVAAQREHDTKIYGPDFPGPKRSYRLHAEVAECSRQRPRTQQRSQGLQGTAGAPHRRSTRPGCSRAHGRHRRREVRAGGPSRLASKDESRMNALFYCWPLEWPKGVGFHKPTVRRAHTTRQRASNPRLVQGGSIEILMQGICPNRSHSPHNLLSIVVGLTPPYGSTHPTHSPNVTTSPGQLSLFTQQCAARETASCPLSPR